jgi:hypothetical protein
VVTAEGRDSRLGTCLVCRACGEAPSGQG